MTEPQMPSPSWWSQPADTGSTVLEQDHPSGYDEPAAPTPLADEPAGPPPSAGEPVGPPSLPSPAPSRSRQPRRRAVLLALALLAAGGTGGAVVAAVDDRSASTASGGAGSSILRSTGSTTSSASSVSSTSGTPESAAAVISPSVVTIEVTGTTAASDGSGQQPVSDTGSGIVLRTDGYVLTNNHVVAAAENGGSVHVTLPDGRTVAATIVGHDASDDLAVIKLTDATGLVAATFADSNRLKVGQTVLAVGAPLGLSNTVTQGIVSTLHRPVRTGESGAPSQSVIDAVQTDAAINPGNSGGALVDLAGHVVGINSAIATTGGGSGSGQSGNIGVGFAIPADDAVKVAGQLIKDGHATHAQMGIAVGNAASRTSGAPGLGATVVKVTAAGPADRAGLKTGDLITQVDDRRVTDADSVIVAVRSHDPGSTVVITYLRAGATGTAKITLEAAASE